MLILHSLFTNVPVNCYFELLLFRGHSSMELADIIDRDSVEARARARGHKWRCTRQ
jgi:hypothetical protein